jgi:hypothetical protein
MSIAARGRLDGTGSSGAVGAQASGDQVQGDAGVAGLGGQVGAQRLEVYGAGMANGATRTADEVGVLTGFAGQLIHTAATPQTRFKHKPKPHQQL